MTDEWKQKVSKFIEDIRSLNPEQAEMIESIAVLFREAGEELSEQIKYGGLVFLQSGTLIGGIFPYSKHISIEFSNGADFTDPLQQLLGKGKRRRHLKIYVPSDLQQIDVLYFIKQALQAR